MFHLLDNTIKRRVTACNFNLHNHSAHPDRILKEHDLIYIREGSWSIYQDGIRYDLAPHDVILLHGCHHHYGVEPCTGIVKTLFIHFDCLDSDVLTDIPRKDSRQYCFPTVVHCRDNPMVENHFRQVIYSYWSEDLFSQSKASAYLDLLLCEIAREETAGNKKSSLVDEILVLMKSTPNHFFSVQELSEKFGFSSKTISSKFKKVTGDTVHSYQMKLKCRMANELMAYHPTLTLKELAQSFGFYDEYHFSKCYKNQYGHSPKSHKNP